MSRKPIITIDGPSGSGKSTLAKLVASRLGYLYVDTGAMYRAFGVAVSRAGLDPEDAGAVEALAEKVVVSLENSEAGPRACVDGEDVTDLIRTEEISMIASTSSKHSGVRRKMVDAQRRMAAAGGVVLEGRDTGTVVCPDAEAKFFFDAPAETRARRRADQLGGAENDVDYEKILEDIKKRDEQDSTRSDSPLKPAEDANIINTDDLSIEAVAEKLLSTIKTLNP